MFMRVLLTYLSVRLVHATSPRRSEKVSDLLELVLWMVMSSLLRARNQTHACTLQEQVFLTIDPSLQPIIIF